MNLFKKTLLCALLGTGSVFAMGTEQLGKLGDAAAQLAAQLLYCLTNEDVECFRNESTADAGDSKDAEEFQKERSDLLEEISAKIASLRNEEGTEVSEEL